MQRLKGVKGGGGCGKRDHYSASLAALGSPCFGAGSAAAQLATVARSTMLGLSVTEARSRSPAQAGCLEKGHGQRRVSALGRAPQASLGATRGERWGLCSTATLTRLPASGQHHRQRL